MKSLAVVCVGILLLNGCAILHRPPVVYGCILVYYDWCPTRMTRGECERWLADINIPKPLPATTTRDGEYASMLLRIKYDFHFPADELLRTWRYVAYVRYRDDSYGIVFQNAPPRITPEGIRESALVPGGLALKWSRYPHVRRQVVWWLQGRHGNLDVDGPCGEPFSHAVIFEIPSAHPRP